MKLRSLRNRQAARLFACVLALSALIALSGCMYPKELRKENQVSYKESVLLVQNAVDQYQKDTGLLPIKNSSAETPQYEKFVIDFSKLTNRNLLSDVPISAFENGGNNYFLIINEETKPTVRLMDLVTFQKVSELEQLVAGYVANHKGEVPAGETVAKNLFRLDFDKLGRKPEQIRSVFSGQYVGFLVDASGKVFVDYAMDVMQAIRKSGKTDFEANADLRTVLVEQSLFVPVKSTPYYWIDNEPKPSSK